MRRVLLLVHRVPVDGAFTLNDLAGTGGRLDEVASVVAATFLVSNGLRRDCELTLLLSQDPARARKVRMEGRRLKFLNPDERSTAALLKNALVRSWTRPTDEMETTPGIFVGPCRPEEDLKAFLGRPGTFWATESGEPLRAASLEPGETGFVLSDPWDPTDQERGLLEASGVPRIAVGPRSLRSSQCVVLFQNELDLREAAQKASGPSAAGASTPLGG
ncbi:MAG: hypothetical protein KGJ23_07055 [Euryarchaeota archaeon]|nr:hypothetical protein [Euryarchaeota archaeon]MDE1836358.1 hypothetical protein [Euryarchaeota archaeon]MDE1879156.1 hypothetical protein [Euryarchaeota archaeon]MDE2044246.1 hypothetical protein [Thermoplasmata archaeon]